MTTVPEPETTIFGHLPGGLADMRLQGPVWIAWRSGGRRLSGAWHNETTLSQALRTARKGLTTGNPDSIEVCLTRDFTEVVPDMFGKSFFNNGRGRFGLEISVGNVVVHRVPATDTIASNRSFEREVQRVIEAAKRPAAQVLPELRFRRFHTEQLLIDLQELRAIRLNRGSQLVAPEDVGPSCLAETIEGLCAWMRNNLHADGRMTYKYWPSRGAESKADNTIRQFMATVALGRIAARSGSPGDADAARRNLTRNFEAFYSEIDGLGTIIHDGKGKLGAMALAALAVLEFRENGLIGKETHDAEFSRLKAGIDALWQPDGSFRTFLVPANRNDNQNFYPGEALLFWAALHRQTRDSDLAARCLTSFRHYRDWHFAQPNPALIPWHTQAYVMLYEDLGHAELAKFVFDRNDWLLGMQQWGGALSPDLWGRFFDPGHPEYGPPHASSTGVYLEGLADAWRLAQRLGDRPRSARYARALRRGLRNIRQLQFRDPNIDAFYVRRKKAVMGGLRTEVYNNEIRVDNVQHCLMALLKIASEPAFPWEADENTRVDATRQPNPLWTAEELAAATGGRWLAPPASDWGPTGLSYDVTGNMRGHICFLPHPESWGPGRRDATIDIPRLARQDAAAIVVQPAHLQTLSTSGHEFPANLPLLQVDDTFRALHGAATAARKRFAGTVFAVTGTVGKTTTREMLRHIIDAQGGATASRANNNNISGVLRSLAYTPRDNAATIIEMGFGKPLDGISTSTKVARPDVAIITTIDVAHFDMFTSEMLAERDGRALLCDHKAQIFSGLEPGGIAVINADIPEYGLLREFAFKHTRNVLGFGRAEDATARLLEVELAPTSSKVICEIFGRRYGFTLPLPGGHMAMNALGALLAVSAADFDTTQAIGALEDFSAVKGRARLIQAPLPNGGTITVVDDSFNATLASMRSTFDLLGLTEPGPGGRRIAVVGEIGHIGVREREEHIALAIHASHSRAELIFTWGPLMRGMYNALPAERRGHHEDESVEALYAALYPQLRDGDVIAIKSGRGVGGLGDVKFRKFVQHLADGLSYLSLDTGT